MTERKHDGLRSALEEANKEGDGDAWGVGRREILDILDDLDDARQGREAAETQVANLVEVARAGYAAMVKMVEYHGQRCDDHERIEDGLRDGPCDLCVADDEFINATVALNRAASDLTTAARERDRRRDEETVRRTLKWAGVRTTDQWTVDEVLRDRAVLGEEPQR